MSFQLYLTFLGATALLFLTPGPAMSLILANAAAHGARAGAKRFFAGQRAQAVERASGAVLVGAGLWFAFARR